MFKSVFLSDLACWNGSSPHLYGGSVKWTENGRICQQWTSQTPHKHTNNKDSQFPTDGSAAGALNYCRDPDGTGFLWCYTVNSEIRWEKCDVPICKFRVSSLSKREQGTKFPTRLHVRPVKTRITAHPRSLI